MKYFDKENNRLLLMHEAATEQFWQEHWFAQAGNLAKRIKLGAGKGLIKKFTEKFLKPNTKIIDAGCGIGQNVYGLNRWGYQAYGADYAAEVIHAAKKEFPELSLYVQDVRDLQFPDAFFDGYWSLGVIEHFKEGYGAIIKEANRVLKPGGYLFITVPWFSPLRALKAALGCYPRFKKEVSLDSFYEFMLDKESVIANVEKEGFHLQLKSPYDAIKGIKDEISLLHIPLQKIYDSRTWFSKIFRFTFTILFAPFAGHIIVLVFKKND